MWLDLTLIVDKDHSCLGMNVAVDSRVEQEAVVAAAQSGRVILAA